MKLTSGPHLSAREREGEGKGGRMGFVPRREKRGARGWALQSENKRGGNEKFSFFFIFKPNFQIHFQIEFLSKLTLCF